MRELSRLSLFAGLLAGLPLAAGADREPGAVEKLIAAEPRLAAQVSLSAAFLDDGSVLADLRGDRPRIPASTLKLATTACALSRLGPAKTFETSFVSERRPDASGRLAADLVLVGGGDPLLRAEELWVLVRGLRAAGVRRVDGELIVDDSLFSGPGRPAAWPQRRVTDPYDAPQGAAALAWNSIEVVVLPGAKLGAPARIETFPLRAGAKVISRVRTGRRTAIRASVPTGEGDVLLLGEIAASGRPWRQWVRLGEPLVVTLAAVEELLAREGIAVSGGSRRGARPTDGVVLARYTSPSLARIVAAINKYSSNFGAEILSRQLALADGVDAPSARDGALAIEHCLARWQLSRGGERVADGSGHARASRLTTRTLLGILERAASEPDWGPEFLVSLPRAGEDGTLQARLTRHRGRLRAKTGSLRGVAGLAGYATTRDGRPLAFALLLNQCADCPKVGASTADRLVAALLADADRPRARPTSSEASGTGAD